MSTQENKAAIESAIRSFNQPGSGEKHLELYAQDVVLHGFPPGLPPGVEGLRRFSRMIHEAFPDVQVSVEDMVAEGDRVAYRFTVRGTHKGPFMDIPATGRKIEIAGQSIIRFKGGKAVERWQAADMLGLLQQIGAAPAPGAAR